MLALKLKLVPSKEQIQLLNEMFWKWATICNRMSEGLTKDNLRPRDGAGIQFSSTQLNQAQTDIKDLKKALEESKRQREYELRRIENRKRDIEETLSDPTKRDIDDHNPRLFRPLLWVEHGLLKTKRHTDRHWKTELSRLERLIKKKIETIKRIERGKIRLKPKRITIHANSVKLSFGGKKLFLNLLSKEGQKEKTIELPMLTTPEQPEIGSRGGKSSQKSREYMQNAIVGFLAFSIDSMFFGMNRAEEMLLKAKNPDKISKKEERIAKKKKLFSKKLKSLEKLLGRKLMREETEVITTENARFFDDPSGFKKSEMYLALLAKLAQELVVKKTPLKLNKYPILIRKPLNRYKCKKLKNLRPDEYEYFIQLSYAPILAIDKSKFVENCVLGIDRGINHLLALAIFDPHSSRFTYNRLIDNPISGWKWRRRKLMQAIQHMERKVRAQTGEHIHEKQMKKRLHSLENKIETHLHRISREIVDLAAERKAVIVMERLEGLRQHGRRKAARLKPLNYALSLFDYEKIARFIRYKAEKAGIQVWEVSAPGTSQNCAKCLLEKRAESTYTRGLPHKGRFNMKIGKCAIHGQIDADLNAARTIAICYVNKLNNPTRVV